MCSFASHSSLTSLISRDIILIFGPCEIVLSINALFVPLLALHKYVNTTKHRLFESERKTQTIGRIINTTMCLVTKCGADVVVDARRIVVGDEVNVAFVVVTRPVDGHLTAKEMFCILRMVVLEPTASSCR